MTWPKKKGRKAFVSEAAHRRSVAANDARWGKHRNSRRYHVKGKPFVSVFTRWRRAPRGLRWRDSVWPPDCPLFPKCGDNQAVQMLARPTSLRPLKLEVLYRWSISHAYDCPEMVKGLKTGRLTKR